MALPTTTMLDAAGVSRTVSQRNSGRQAAADSAAGVWSTEDLAAIGATNEAAPASDVAAAGLNGRMQRLAQRLSALILQVPATLGVKTSSASLAVVVASDDAAIGPIAEATPALDTDASGLNGGLKRIAARLTTLLGRVPASLGARTSATSFAVVLATDDAAVGTKITAATMPGGGVGILGWLSAIWSALTSDAPLPVETITGDTTAAGAKVLFAANAAAVTRSIGNLSDTIMYVGAVGATTGTSGFPVAPGAIVGISSRGALDVFCTVAGKAFVKSEG